MSTPDGDALDVVLVRVMKEAAKKLQTRPLYVLFAFGSGEEHSFKIEQDGVIDVKCNVGDANQVFPVQIVVTDRLDLASSTEFAHGVINLVHGGAGRKSQLRTEIKFTGRRPN